MARTKAWGKEIIKEANTNRNGSGTIVELYHANTPCWVEKIRFFPAGDNAVCVGRAWVHDGSQSTQPQSFSLIDEVGLPAIVGSGQVAVLTPVDMVCEFYMEAGQRIVAAVSIDLTASAGYYGSVYLGEHRSDFEAA